MAETNVTTALPPEPTDALARFAELPGLEVRPLVEMPTGRIPAAEATARW